MATATLPPVPADLPPPDIDGGVITNGLCATPEAQAEFDATQAGRPVLAQ